MLKRIDNRKGEPIRQRGRRSFHAAALVSAALVLLVAYALPVFGKPAAHRQQHVSANRHQLHHSAHHSGRHRHALRARHAHRKRATGRLAPVHAAILIDADTGEVLYARNPDRRTYPASLTKMMTLYLTFQSLNEGRLRLDQRLPVSAHAARQEPTKLWLKAGDSVRVRNLILGLVTRSANDAAVVLAEGIAGSEAAFAKRMSRLARRLGMTRSTFRNASGLPDPAQHTTARDMARLALALYQNFPREYAYFATKRFNFRGHIITGHNHLLDTYRGADGLKTGFIDASGFNLVASAARDGHRLIGVILGGPSPAVRDHRMAALLDRGFAERDASEPTIAGEDRLVPGSAGKAPPRARARLVALLSPAASAAPQSHRKHKARRTRSGPTCAIQFGAYRTRAPARLLARRARRLKLAEGKPVRIVGPEGPKKLYRVQLVGFTKNGAQSACARLKKSLHCVVVPSRRRP